MMFNFTHAWILVSIKLSESEKEGSSLRGIIGTSDYINHGIITYNEFDQHSTSLLSHGQIMRNGKKFKTSTSFREWWAMQYESKKSFAVLKAVSEAEKYLNSLKLSDVQTISHGVTPEEFDTAVQEYLSSSPGH